MANWGFNMSNMNDFTSYAGKEPNPDLLIGGEIIYLAYGTRLTPGFKIALLIEWSIYDVSKEEIVYKLTTGGYSHTGALQSSDELIITLQDALTGLMVDQDFVKLCSK
jgi:hypothetical protein